MDSCMTAPSFYLNYIIMEVYWHSVEGNLTETVSDINQDEVHENHVLENIATSLMDHIS